MREKHILFSQRYLEKLLSGEKRATIRLRCPGLRPGDKALVHCGGRIIGEVEVLAVYRKRLRDITIDEALLDGFISLHELRLHLKKHYPGVRENAHLCILIFRWINVYPEAISDAAAAWPYKATFQEVAQKALEHLELSEFEKSILGLVAKTGSIRKAAYEMGGLSQRFIIRDVLRRAAQLLEKKGMIQRGN
ncbi:MAG: ASCH domain-containing protein [Thermofilum sp.]|jgi:hypothetical protein|nr:ASCH domain-containing protein [Thermofilum sp.]